MERERERERAQRNHECSLPSLHLGLGEEHMALDHWVVFAELQFGRKLSGILGLDIEESRPCC